MEPRVAILSIDTVPVEDIVPALMEYVTEESITRVSLLGDLSRAEIQSKFAPANQEDSIVATLNDGSQIDVGRDKISLAMQKLVSRLDKQDYEVILLITSAPLSHLNVVNAVLLDSYHIIPPLIAAVVQGDQVGMIVSGAERIQHQKQKWLELEQPPMFEVVDLNCGELATLLEAGRSLIAKGATAIVLDCPEFLAKHRDFLQENLSIPVLLSNVFIIKIAAELLV